MQQNVIEHRAEHIAAGRRILRLFHRFGNGATERAARFGKFAQDPSARLGGFRRRGNDVRAVCADDLFAVGFLLGRDLHHKDVELQPVERRRHRERRAPLPRARFGRNRTQALFFGVIRLRRRGVELMRARSIVAFEFIIDFRGRIENTFEKISAHQRRRAEGFIKIADIFGNFDIFVGVVQFLIDTFVAEHRTQVFFGAGFARRGIQKGIVRTLHVRLHVIPRTRHFLLGKIGFVGNFRSHTATSLKNFMENKNTVKLAWDEFIRVATQFHNYKNCLCRHSHALFR